MEKTNDSSNELKHTGRWNSNGEYKPSLPVQLLDAQSCNPCLIENNQLVTFNDDFELELIDNQYLI